MNPKLLQSLVDARKILQKKYMDLKRGLLDENLQREKDLKPVTESLQTLIKLNEVKNTLNEEPLPIEKNVESLPQKLASENDLEAALESKDYTHLNEKTIRKLLVENDSKIDKTYGIKLSRENKLLLGGNSFKIEGEKLLIGGKVYEATSGLFELILLNKPQRYNENELLNYKKILTQTGVHLNVNGRIKSNASYKYKNIIKDFFISKLKQGSGYTYWNDPNELVDRLRLLVASKNAGHSNHNNEIISIIEELRESNFIY